MIKKILLVLAGLILFLVVGFVAWGATPLGPLPETETALQSDAVVQVEAGKWLVFRPAGQAADAGLIYYPGGRVDYRSYAPYAREIASAGYLVVVPAMPLSLAVMAPDSATEIIRAFPEIEHWAVGGHSLGGAMAASYAYNHPQEVEGLVLLAAYPAGSSDLKQSAVKVISIYATLDGLATGENIEASKALLPDDTLFVPIEGGNHAQFGWYGEQNGDNEAKISREEQQSQVVTAITGFLRELSE